MEVTRPIAESRKVIFHFVAFDHEQGDINKRFVDM